MSEITTFVDDDTGYREWIYTHLSGYVINTGRTATASYLILHTTLCDHIAPAAGSHWTRDYIKVCSDSRASLDAWAHSSFGMFPTPCSNCEP